MNDPAPPTASLDAWEQEADRAVALRHFDQAERQFIKILALDPTRIESWLKLAAVRRATGNIPAALDAVSSALHADPLHFMALLSKARLLEADGQTAEAARTYAHALAQLPDETPPAALQSAIAHARARADTYAQEVEATWDRAIVDPALSPLEIAKLHRLKTNALRRTKVYHSEPTHYHYPGLPEFEFHPREHFPWLATLEAATPAILRELRGLLDGGDHRAEPYIQYPQDVPLRQWVALNNSMDWTALHLLHGGKRIHANADRCPETLAVLDTIGQPHIAGRSPNAMFSLLKPRTHIPPHTGVANTRLVCHLPLVVPEGCWFRVGAERRLWRAGEAFVFDDTMEHEAANESDEQRIVLIVDIWHPALTATERAAIKRVMEAEEARHGMAL